MHTIHIHSTILLHSQHSSHFILQFYCARACVRDCRVIDYPNLNPFVCNVYFASTANNLLWKGRKFMLSNKMTWKVSCEQPKRVLTQYSWYNLNLNHIFQFIGENSVHTSPQGDSSSTSELRYRCYGPIPLISPLDLLGIFSFAIACESPGMYLSHRSLLFSHLSFSTSVERPARCHLSYIQSPHIYISQPYYFVINANARTYEVWENRRRI